MLAVLKKEFKSYFLSPIGYVVIGIFLFVFSVFFYLTTILYGTVDLGSLYFYTALYGLIIIAPILTMRMFAEERKSGTEQLILTSPVSMIGVVFGKFLAAMGVIVITLLLSFMYFFIVQYFGKPNLSAVLVHMLGFVLVSGAAISIGMFASSITENQIIAGVITIAFLVMTLFLQDVNSVFTSQEIWDFCKRYSLGPEEPVPPILTSADPEDRSFDLPASTQEFVFTFDKAVDCGQVTAELAGDGGTYPLQLAETGFSETLTFSLPEGENVPDGDYTLSLRNIVGENEAKAETYTYHYTLGLTEVGLEIDIDTLLLPDWAAEQSTVGEGIPTGWKRVNSRADGSKDEQGSGAANVAGARLKYFPAGGDFVSGFYLSARDYDVCRFTYGDYEDYRLHLVPGRYKLSFRSVYWSAGSETGSATFSATVTGISSGAVAFSGSSLPSSGCMNEVSTTAVSGSYLHEYTFEVTAEDDYRLEFNMSQGWSSVIIGAVKLTTGASVADVYKGGFLRAMHEAQIVYDGTSGERYAASKDLRDVLGELLERYDGFASTSPSTT